MSLCHDSKWLVLHISSSLIGDGLPPRDTSCPTMLCFEGHGFNDCKLTHSKDLDVGDEVTPADV